MASTDSAIIADIADDKRGVKASGSDFAFPSQALYLMTAILLCSQHWLDHLNRN